MCVQLISAKSHQYIVVQLCGTVSVRVTQIGNFKCVRKYACGHDVQCVQCTYYEYQEFRISVTYCGITSMYKLHQAVILITLIGSDTHTNTHEHTKHTHARTHARTHAHTHARAHTHCTVHTCTVYIHCGHLPC